MLQWNLVIFFIFAHLLGCVQSYPRGAPSAACNSMMPSHDVDAQPSASPFSVKVETRGSSVKVTIEDSDSKTPFKGFLLKAFYQDGTDVHNGIFTSDSMTKTLDCGFGDRGALTHNSKADKLNVITTWLPPPGFSNNVFFRATIVAEYKKFWVRVQSNTVFVQSNQTVQATTSVITGMQSSSTLPVADLYSGCGSSKGCFGMPRNCIEKRSCEVVLTYASDPSLQHTKFQLVGALGLESGWIAVGLSRDTKMGDDSVTECVFFGGKVLIRESWNYAKPEKGNFVLTGPKNISDEKGEYEDGIITCSWNRPFSTVANGITFNTEKENFYLLLAKGPVDSSGGKLVHNSKSLSANKVDLNSASLVLGKLTTLVKIHGSFMTVGWICFVSLGILLARHFKEVWTKYKLCGEKVWFAVHRCFMLLSIAFVIAGFIAIFIDVDGWSEVGRNPHPILGCIATGLIVLQPFVAACRPSPTSPSRPIFRWIHGLIGNGGQLIAVINMFFAVELKNSNVPQAFHWVLGTFCIFHCLIHLLIHIHSCLMESERERESNSKINQFQVGDGYSVNEDGPTLIKVSKRVEPGKDKAPDTGSVPSKSGAPSTDKSNEYSDDEIRGSAFKKFALGIYSMVVIGLTAALVLMICLN